MRHVGMLIKGYRDAAGLSQGNLADMLRDGHNHSGSRDRSQISNYERGRFLPSEEFLTSFIEAVKPRLAERGIELTEKDASHLLYIAGYASQTDVDVHELRTTVSEGQERLHAGMTDVRVGQERLQGGLLALSERVSNSTNIDERVKDILIKMAPPAIYVATVGYAIDALGLIRNWVLLAYFIVGIGIVASTVMLRRFKNDADDRLGDLFFVSVFFMLNSPLLQGAFTRMDHYGFHTLPQYEGGTLPFVLAMTVNLLLALTSSIIFNVLRNWLRTGNTTLSPLARAVYATLPPVAFLYTNILIFGNPGMWVYFLAVFAMLFGYFVAIAAFRDPQLRLIEGDTWMSKAAFALIVLLASFWAIGTFVAYAEPSIVASGDHNTFWSSDTESAPFEMPSTEHFPKLGYPADEYLERVRFGMLWMSLATNIYIAIVFGFNIMSAIRNRLREA